MLYRELCATFTDVFTDESKIEITNNICIELHAIQAVFDVMVM